MAEQPSRIVVTGASGYLGQHLIELLANKGYQVVALVREPEKLFKKGVEASYYDLKSSAKLPAEVFSNAAAVVHAAVNINDSSLSEQMEIEAAQRLVKQASRAGVQRLVFISSCVANPDGLSRYARVKWAIEQVFKDVGGMVVRPGLVYGDSAGTNRGLFALLDRWAKFAPFLPGFMPPLWVKTIHVDDLCAVILNGIEKTENPVPIYEAAAEDVHLTAFLRRLAWHRHRRYPMIIPFPVLLVSFAAAVGRAVPFVSAHYVEWLTRLRAMRHPPSGETDAGAGVTLRPLGDGLSHSSRRRLLEEGQALGRYLNGKFPGYMILSQYVRGLEYTVSQAQRYSLDLAPLYLKWPIALRLIDPKSPLCRLAPDLRDEIAHRIQVMAALSEANLHMAPKYHVHKPALLPLVILDLLLRISVDVFLRGLGAIVRLGCRLPKRTNRKDSRHATIKL